MTTMFIQLRRVVYLLVLLQCCVCVYDVDGAPGDTEYTDMVTKLNSSIVGAGEMLLKGEFCLPEWEKYRNACDTDAALAKKSAGELSGIVKDLERKIDEHIPDVKGTGGIRVSVTLEKVKELGKQVEKTKQKTNETLVEAEKARLSVAKAQAAQDGCATIRNNIESARADLDRILEGFLGYMRDGDSEVNKRLDKDGRNMSGKMVAYVLAYGHRVGWSKGYIKAAEEKIAEAKEEAKKAVAALKKIDARLAEQESLAEEAREKGGLVQKAIKEMSESKETEERIGSLTHREKAKEKRVETAKEVAKEMKKAIEDSIKEKEKRDKEERERREREERERKERERIEREERERNEREEKEKREREERERKEREGKEKRDREERERRLAEEKAKRDEAERMAQEKEELEKKAKKRKDGGVVFTLAHGPLVMLLLCVLGFALVC
ncbi:uncharacterized protein TM35_000062800 [Trypanosoma theileri]|uniref:Uncharacterized protein n=1 Tax=Trypanosoma theileri TaxID=67003 RepID=A0A1X0P314_9TRYP|nr:uncharacterized protein TM35_000062800 [Trypanosoma theileri]ORC91275.1 hypothetical protein TM35_000062800 [Trypanosoma theileri]